MDAFQLGKFTGWLITLPFRILFYIIRAVLNARHREAIREQGRARREHVRSWDTNLERQQAEKAKRRPLTNTLYVGTLPTSESSD